ncbi:hypothetical protein JGC56_17550 [Salmonella enterica subsp. enterica serovar Saintpaul]|nr:hypothetical protein [Salmonella enterica subsp. enterica serovar Saintpaul]
MLTNDNSPAARGVCDILETLSSYSILSDKHFFIMTGGLPYTAKQHKAVTKVIRDPSMIVIVIELRSRGLLSYHLQFRREHVYYLDGATSLQEITSDLNAILNDVDKKIKGSQRPLSEQVIVNNISADEKASLVGMLSNQSCKSYAEESGLSIRLVSECRRNVIMKLGTCSPALLHAQLCVDGAVEDNTLKVTSNEKETASIIYYARLLQDLITLEGVKTLRNF